MKMENYGKSGVSEKLWLLSVDQVGQGKSQV